MGKRGRPRHPDILTPREREVLALIRDGLSNEDIARRLGISIDGVKYHVSQILSKLGVSTRQEAADWNEALPPWWQRVLAPLAFISRRTSGAISRLSPLSSALAVGVLCGALGGFAALAFIVLYTNHRSQSSSAVSPSAEPPGIVPVPVNGWPGMMHSFFVDGLHGWVPIDNVLFQTMDGGATWDREYDGPENVGDVYFISPQVGWRSGGGQISEDGGRSWRDTGHPGVASLRYFDGTDGWAASDIDYKTWKTADGGASWQAVDGPCAELARSENGATPAGGAPKVKVVSRPVSFIDRDTGWALCAESSQSGGDHNKLYQTTDGGNHWKLLAVLPWDTLSIQFIDKRHGWLLNYTGLNATDDGGRSWYQVANFQKTGAIPPISSQVQLVSPGEGFLSYAADPSGPSAIFSTHDGGRTWTQIYTGPSPFSAQDVRICEAKDVEAQVWTGLPAGFGQGDGGIAFRIKSSTACRLAGTPVLEMLDGDGNVVATTVNQTCADPESSCDRRFQDVVLQIDTLELQQDKPQPPGQGSIFLTFPVYGPEGPPCQPPMPPIVTLSLSWPSSDGALVVPNSGLGPCHTIDVRPFQPTGAVP